MKIVKWILAGSLCVAIFTYWQIYTVTSGLDGKTAFFEVATGETLQNILPRLRKENLIRNQIFVKLYARIMGLDTKVKAGRFQLGPDFTPARIIRFFADPDNGEVSVTIPEGFSIFDIDKKLAELELISKGEFIKFVTRASAQREREAGTKEFRNQERPSDGRALIIKEGFLFPDTYFVFSKNFRPEDLGRAMQKNFEKKVLEGLKEDFSKTNRTVDDIVKMASILEKEVQTKNDFPIVAGILWKRSEHGWPLQVDASILYGKENRDIDVKDFRKDMPYNTYTRLGLPPTAIGNPGLETIRAALHPENSPYWFYLTTPEGKVIYAKTNAEHERNKRYLH